jgi:nucleotide-binding universal stress UspA family protein
VLQFKKILCPTDFSEPSWEALSVAGALAKILTAELIVLHVVDPLPVPDVPTKWIGPAGFETGTYMEMLNRVAKETLHQHVTERLPKAPHVREEVDHGTPAQKIIDVAAREHVDLIVIATHGRTGLRHLLLGSVAERVIHLSSCPVLAIPWRALHESAET